MTDKTAENAGLKQSTVDEVDHRLKRVIVTPKKEVLRM